MLDDPSAGRNNHKKPDAFPEYRQHVVGIVSKGHLLGIEDAVIAKAPYYTTGAIVSQAVELYRIDREQFSNILKPTFAWNVLVKKSIENVQNWYKSLRNMKESNLVI